MQIRIDAMFTKLKSSIDIPLIRTLLLSRSFFIWFIPTLILLQLVSIVGESVYHERQIENATNQVKQRIALDLTHNLNNLPMAFNDTKGDNPYLVSLNQFLRSHQYPIQVSLITHASPPKEPGQEVVKLLSINEDVYIVFSDNNSTNYFAFISIWPLFFAFIAAFLYVLLKHQNQVSIPTDPLEISDPCRLIIDLKQKVLVNPLNGSQVAIANKPLCFYTALIEYSLKHPENSLNPNKELPDEFSHICKKYFARLIELGHTIRKRPNFASNLEKTLSEIRAALDELYGDDAASKESIYPKKAIGEGSRSKAHNFALTTITENKIKILGS